MKLVLTARQKELATGLFVVVLIGGMFAAGELTFRLINLAKFGVAVSVEASDRFYVDERTGLRLRKPNTVHGNININSLGFRGPEIKQPKPPNVFRIVFLGSSRTFDPYVSSDSKTWPHLTVDNLKKSLPGCRIDYANVSAPGFSTEPLTVYLDNYVSALQPDLAVVLANDINIDTARLAKVQGIYDGQHVQESWLARRSLLWSKIEKNIVVVKRQRSAHLSADKLRFGPSELTREFEGRLDRLVKRAAEIAGAVALLTRSTRLDRGQSPREQAVAAQTALYYMPYMSISGLLDAQDAYNRVIEKVARNAGAILIAGHQTIPSDALHYADSAHFTVLGSRVMARRVADGLLADPSFIDVLQARTGGCAGPARE